MNFQHKTIIGPPFLAMPSRAFTGSVLPASKPLVSESSSRNQAYWSRNANLWTSHWAWRRAAINTLRRLLDCSIGNFSTMWYLQGHYPGLDIGTTMALLVSFTLSHFAVPA